MWRRTTRESFISTACEQLSDDHFFFFLNCHGERKLNFLSSSMGLSLKIELLQNKLLLQRLTWQTQPKGGLMLHPVREEWRRFYPLQWIRLQRRLIVRRWEHFIPWHLVFYTVLYLVNSTQCLAGICTYQRVGLLFIINTSAPYK